MGDGYGSFSSDTSTSKGNVNHTSSSTDGNKYNLGEQQSYNTDKQTWAHYDGMLSAHFSGGRSATGNEVKQWQQRMKDLRAKWKAKGKSFPDSCTTSRDDLRLLHLLYKDINGDTCEGEMICNVAIADSLVDIFRQLYDNDYPIEKMVLIDEYGGDDDASMADNNTSCFNYREVSGTGKLSKHAYGLAVDLNPRYNPYIHKINGETLIEPENGKEYADRSLEFDYKIDEDDLAYKLFTGAGFTWGGSWKISKDYQHFQYTP